MEARLAVTVVVDDVVDVVGDRNEMRGEGVVDGCFRVMLYTLARDDHSCNGWPLRRHRGQEY